MFVTVFVGFNFLYCHTMVKTRIMNDVFGFDGNGGKMLKILTDLTDEEMARLKHARRLAWHWRGSRTMYQGEETISDQELSDRGIQLPQEPYAEYIKRPPHDKYL
mmetsp:Transcript_32817/g.50116  ORF Transcript_32817/g.50116 Transcript_32817/m.50116 type:complete len:105 (-) Transcript_32817:43-357(-)